MKSRACPIPSAKYLCLSARGANEFIIRASDDVTENLSCPPEEIFIAYLEISGKNVSVFSSADFKEHNYQQGIADGLNLAADKIQSLLDQNGIA